VDIIYSCSGYEIELYFVACDRCVFLKTITQMIPVRIQKINRAHLGRKGEIGWRKFLPKIQKNWRMSQVASTGILSIELTVLENVGMAMFQQGKSKPRLTLAPPRIR
jgi:hypothetical protein